MGIPALNDNYWIFGELKYILRIGFAVFVAQCGVVFFANPDPQSLMYLLFIFLTTLCAVMVVFVMTIGVFIKRRTFNIHGAEPTTECFDVLVDDEPRNAMDLQGLLEEEKGFESFMRWLAKEWSTENLLFMLETVQYQRLLIDQCDTDSVYALDRKATNLDLDIEISFPLSCPNSDIVYGDSSIVKKAELLCQKYVVNDAVFLINIAHSTKKKIENMMTANKDGDDPQALTRLFNRAQKEIWIVMKGSFQRYQKTKSYKILEHNLSKRNSKSVGKPLIEKLRKVSFVSKIGLSGV